jgi:phosphatidate cytidylyltransferase
MFKQRLLTALLLIPLVVGSVVFLSSQQIALLFAGVVGLAAWEWSRLAGLHSTASRAVYVVGTLALLWGAYYLSPYVVLLVALGWWLVALVWIARFGDPKMTWPPWLRAIAGSWCWFPPGGRW